MNARISKFFARVTDAALGLAIAGLVGLGATQALASTLTVV